MNTTDTESVLKRILDVTTNLSQFNDLDSVLDHILTAARSFAGADAGSIFLVDGDRLIFSYVQNDTLFASGTSNKYLYTDSILDLNNKSIAGYVAFEKKSLNLIDVHKLPDHVSYTFNTEFDATTGYYTQSMLSVPLISSQDNVVGVMSLINAVNEKNQIISFCDHDELFISTLAYHATVAIERTIMNREMILRMLATSRLRDPMETGPHVQRVGAYSSEIYQHWATKQGVSQALMNKNRDTLRLAAMLHDIGKVAISDLILKKPGRLTDEEFNTMKNHTIYGARLLSDGKTELDRMSCDIALNHHERWDGNGYPGRLKDLHRNPIEIQKGKKEKELSLYGSIVAVADVYDALSAKRVYKQAWPQERVLEEIRSSSGTHFNPDIVDSFFEIYEIIDAIRMKFREKI